jgi:thymidine kinase
MLEFSSPTRTAGHIEVVVGCMYSGKTEELIRQIRRAELANLPFQVFKPRIDDRYSKNHIASHSQQKFPTQLIDSAEEIMQNLRPNTRVVGLDEGQFFDEKVIHVANLMAKNGRRVVIAGLDTDWQGRPFGFMPQLMAIADLVRKQHAICMVCGGPATRTQRLVHDDSDILVGSDRIYEARCREHFDPYLKKAREIQEVKENLLRARQLPVDNRMI